MSSRLHFQITSKNGVPFIEDLNSRNGTQINGLDLAPGEEMDISFFDFITVGENHFMIFDTTSIVHLDKQTLEKKMPFIAPSSFKQEAIKKSVALFAYVLPEMFSVKSQVDSKVKMESLLAKREKDLDTVSDKKKIIDDKKAELDRVYQEKLSKLNDKYEQIDELKNKVISKYSGDLEELDEIIESNINFIKNRKVQHFYESEDAKLTHAQDENNSTVHNLEINKDK